MLDLVVVPHRVTRMKNQGFTLIELLVVIFIIGILFSLILPNFTGARERAQDANIKHTMNALRTSLRLYHNDNDAYPAPSSRLIPVGFFATYLPELAVSGVGFTYAYEVNLDTFAIGASLFNKAGSDDTDSAIRCGKTPLESYYYVCGR